MNLSVIQIVLLLFAVFALTKTFQRFRAREMQLVQLLPWLVFWGGVILVVLRPDTTSRLADMLGVGRGADVIVYLALALMFYLQFRLFAKIEETERQITKLVREDALKGLKEETDA